MRDLVDGKRVFSVILMYRPLFKKMCYIIVEGITDKRFYSKFVDNEKCKIIVADNKNNVIEAVKIANKVNFKGIVGIVDKDFDGLMNNFNNIKNLYKTDDHDIENMMFKSRAFDDVLKEYVDENKLTNFVVKTVTDLKNIIIKNGIIIGCLRFYSLLNDIWLNFEYIKYDDIINKDNFTLDIDKLINYILNNSKNITKPVEEIRKSLDELLAKNYNPYDICCGHDLIYLLYLVLKYKIGGYNIKSLTSGGLEGSFRLAYNINYFKETTLYNSLLEWARNNMSFNIFPAEEYTSPPMIAS
ncbi:DUF4435 domain-containing protein [Thermoanaerobacterium sp. DL9XJH110]|uniref:DUF4435 domain-containing protein n=1 Tax=Thermoanaerobacterium sp. DL9XJH110 TaxID=3386643 RepID=UPI003BB4F72C